MANEEKLPEFSPENGITRVKRLSIYVTSDAQNPARTLKFHIYGYTPADRNEDGGTLITSAAPADKLIEDFMADNNFVEESFLRTSPLDFSIQKKCYVALKLVGDFWQFSDVRDAITTKDKHSDNRYYRLRRHEINQRIRGASFCAKEPHAPNGDGTYIRHGLNFYVDFLQGASRLPVIIDPDIQNKGGSGGGG